MQQADELIELLEQHVYVKDRESKYLSCNRAYAAFLGIVPEEILGKSDYDFFPGDVAKAKEDDDRIVLTEHATIDKNETLVLREENKYVRTVKKPLAADGEITGILGTSWEISYFDEREKELREIEEGFLRAQELAHIGHWELDLTKNRLYWSDEVYRIFGLQPQELDASYEGFLAHVHPDDVDAVNEAYTNSIAEKTDYRICHRIVQKDGSVRYVEERCRHDFDAGGNVARSIGTVHDVTAEREAQEQLHLMAKVVENSRNGVMITDADTKIIYANDSLCRMSGYGLDELMGKTPSIMSSGHHERTFYQIMWHAINTEKQWHGEIRDRKKDGALYIAELSIHALKNEQDEVTNYIAITDDISEKKKRESIIHNLAYYDSLTDLPNRVLFRQEFEKTIEIAARKQEQCALLFFDLDNFKYVNDTLGHLVGDKLLAAVAVRLKKLLRSSDILCRLGGDEFTLIMESGTNTMEAAHIAERINDAMVLPYEIDNNRLFVGASIGISMYPDDGQDYATLLKAADTAMYHTKDTGKSSFHFYTESLNEMAMERLTIENELRYATERNEIFLVYQPKVDLLTNRVYGVEALVRWEHPEMGMISPERFIPVAEETGLINQVGSWVALQALSDVHALHGEGYEELIVSINVSNVQINQEHFVSAFMGMLINSGIDRRKVEIEITESTLMKNIDVIMRKLVALNEQGIRLAIDDFGTGYSSLHYLKKLPVQTLKIDRSFIRDIVCDADDRTITAAIVSLAKNMNMDVIAEGTEAQEQIDVLKSLDCNKVQGFVFAKPMPFKELRTWLHENGHI